MLFINVVPQSLPPSHPARRRHAGLRYLILAVALAFGSLPMAAWAKAPSAISTQVSPARPATSAPIQTEARTAVAQNYASREASAKDLQKFEGGGSTVWIGGSTLVIVLLVILIVVLI